MHLGVGYLACVGACVEDKLNLIIVCVKAVRCDSFSGAGVVGHSY